MKSMTNKKLVATVARDSGVSKRKVNTVVEALKRAIIVALGEGKTVNLHGFGTFILRFRKARTVVTRFKGVQRKVEHPSAYYIRFRPTSAVAHYVKDSNPPTTKLTDGH